MSSFWMFVTKDWIFAIPMILMSISGIALITWRILLNRGILLDIENQVETIKTSLSRDGIKATINMVSNQKDWLSILLFSSGIKGLANGIAASRKELNNTVEFEITPRLHFLLPTMLAIAKISTMVGLLGTVISMIGTFTKIQEAQGGVSEQAGSIGLALFATALGLITAIPLVFAHVLFKAQINDFEIKIKKAIQKFLEMALQIKTPLKP